MRRFMGILDRVFDPGVLEQAFGAPGEAGDPERTIHVARGVVQVYESMMDWAAELRNTNIRSDFEEVLELTARMADGPIQQIREFIQLVADQVARIPVLLQEAETKGATIEAPMELELTLHVELDPENQAQLLAALDGLR